MDNMPQGLAMVAGLAVLVLAWLGVLRKQARTHARLTAALRAELAQARATSDAKTRFFAAAGHDLHQPLQALSINAFALAVLARRQGQPEIARLADAIETALRQSMGLLDDLLDVSRLDAGAVHPDWVELDLGVMLDGLAREFLPLAAERGLSLVVERPDAPLWVRTDADLLRRILTNLLGNALKFTPAGGVRLILTSAPAAGRAAAGDHLLLAVQDTGVGIALADQGRVFEAFYQAANPARERLQGLGLGLAIVHRLAGVLGIGLRLQSQPGQGTRFELLLPVGLGAGVARPLAPRD